MGDHDKRVLLTRLALVVSALAMIATSPADPKPQQPPPQYFYEFTKEVAGPPAVLTSEDPQATFLVRLRASGEAPNGSVVTGNPLAVANGTITASGGASNGTFVNVRLGGLVPGAEDGELTVLTSFSLAHGFSLGCVPGSDCTASLIVDFVRSDGGDNGGTVNIDWSLVVDARASKGEAPDEGPLELPWTIEISAQ